MPVLWMVAVNQGCCNWTIERRKACSPTPDTSFHVGGDLEGMTPHLYPFPISIPAPGEWLP